MRTGKTAQKQLWSIQIDQNILNKMQFLLNKDMKLKIRQFGLYTNMVQIDKKKRILQPYNQLNEY